MSHTLVATIAYESTVMGSNGAGLTGEPAAMASPRSAPKLDTAALAAETAIPAQRRRGDAAERDPYVTEQRWRVEEPYAVGTGHTGS